MLNRLPCVEAVTSPRLFCAITLCTVSACWQAAMQAHLRELHQEHGTKGDTAALLQRLRTGGADGSTAAGTTTAGGALFAADGSPLQHPRTARVNLIKSSVEEVLQVLRQAGAAAGAGSKAAALADAVQVRLPSWALGAGRFICNELFAGFQVVTSVCTKHDVADAHAHVVLPGGFPAARSAGVAPWYRPA